jgi:hypothetical protein
MANIEQLIDLTIKSFSSTTIYSRPIYYVHLEGEYLYATLSDSSRGEKC